MKNNFFNLKGKTSNITGGGKGWGTGRSITLALAKSGSEIVIANINLYKSYNQNI